MVVDQCQEQVPGWSAELRRLKTDAGKKMAAPACTGGAFLIEKSARSVSPGPRAGFGKKPEPRTCELSASSTRSLAKSGAYGTSLEQFRRCNTSNLLANFGVRMLCCRKSVTTGMSSHPTVSYVVPSPGVPQFLTELQSVNFPTSFKTTTDQTTAGGPYGNELRPD